MGTCGLQRFLGVGGSGRSPLECPTSEISAGARARAEILLALERERYTLWRWSTYGNFGLGLL